MVWENVSKTDYLNSGLGNENKITVTWRPGLFGDTKSRKCVISSSAQWHTISMNDSFVPRYKDGKPPEDPDAQILTLSEYYPKSTIDEREKGAQALKNALPSSMVVTTALNTISGSRLIVDGLKRCLEIVSKINNSQELPSLTILECYGPSVPQIFSKEFQHMVGSIG